MHSKYTRKGFLEKRKVISVIGPSIAYVPLTQGYFSLIDSDDIEKVEKHNWHCLLKHGKTPYAHTGTASSTYKLALHALILAVDEGFTVDHKNADRTLDNRKINLRPATLSQQQHNKKKQSNNTSGYKGVFWDKRQNKWSASICINRKIKYLGSSHNIMDMVEKRRIATEELHREFARL